MAAFKVFFSYLIKCDKRFPDRNVIDIYRSYVPDTSRCLVVHARGWIKTFEANHIPGNMFILTE